MKRLIFICLSIFALQSCDDDKKPVANDVEMEQPDTLLQYSMKIETLRQTEKDCKGDECTYISLRIPVLQDGDTDVRSKINEYIDTQIRESVKSRLPEPMGNATLASMADAFIEGYNLFVMEFPDTDQKWYMEIAGDSSVFGEGYFTLYLQHSEYLGGAHGAAFEQLQSFDLSTGQTIDLADRYDMNALKKEADRMFRKKHGLKADADLNDAGFMFENGIFTLPENIGLMPNGLLLVYNSYEVASYAEGETSLLIPYSAIAKPV